MLRNEVICMENVIVIVTVTGNEPVTIKFVQAQQEQFLTFILILCIILKRIALIWITCQVILTASIIVIMRILVNLIPVGVLDINFALILIFAQELKYSMKKHRFISQMNGHLSMNPIIQEINVKPLIQDTYDHIIFKKGILFYQKKKKK